jgi:general secretion pathway protein L
VSPVVLGVAQVGVDLIAARQAESRAVAGARAIWPRAVPAGSGIDVVRTRLAARQTSDRFADLAADLFAAIERTPGAQIDGLAYGPAGLTAALSYANYSDMDQLITAGGRVGLLITADSTVTEGGRITSDISVRRQP